MIGDTKPTTALMSSSEQDHEQDVPSPIDLRDPRDATAWAETAEAKRPWRRELRQSIAVLLHDQLPPPLRVLELGPGPGLLAEEILARCVVVRLTLLDFSPTFLEMCRTRLGENPAVRYVLGDFTQPDWPTQLEQPFDAVVSMQAAHEVRHKRHSAALHGRALSLLRPGGLCVVCDHAPREDNSRSVALMSTQAEQHGALELAGFVGIATHVVVNGQYVCWGRRPVERRGTPE